jgi:serine protease Do
MTENPMTGPVKRPKVAAAAAGALALALATTALTPWSPRSAEAQSQPPAATVTALPRAGTPDFADQVARVAPSVVRVTVSGHERAGRVELPPELRGTPFERFFRQQQMGPQNRTPRPVTGQGSGFIIDAAGYIVTNNHVVGEAEKVRVELADGRELQAKVVGSDPQTDLALLKVEAGQPLPALQWGDSDRLRVGEWVLAMGNPFGLGGSATVGIVSARGRQIGAGPYDDFIQTDAPINPGNSGGPLFDASGQVIGINTAIFSPNGASAGIGFAVPSALARQVVDQLKANGRVERGWLGVSMQRMDEEMATAVGAPDRKGALVAGVQPGSPAEKAGLQPGDVILGFDGRPIQAPRDLAEAVAAAKPGTESKLTVLREGERIERAVSTGRPPGARMAAAEERGGGAAVEDTGGPALGVKLAKNARGPGAVVAEVVPDSVAGERGLRAGDVILRAGGRAVEAPEDVVKAVRAARQEKRAAIALQVDRQGERAFVAVPLQAAGGPGANAG